MTTIEQQLAELGDHLDLDETNPEALVAQVLARADDDRRVTLGWRGAAAAVVVLAVVVTAVPSSRRTVAGWLGFERARIERRPDLDVPDSVPAVPDGSSLVPGDTVVVVDGARIVVSALGGSLVLEKAGGSETAVVPVDVAGRPGVWIAGAPHEVVYRTAAGSVVVDRFAGNTLLWQDGPVIRRVEGFADVDDALAFASSLGT